jgi:transcription termination factor NusB
MAELKPEIEFSTEELEQLAENILSSIDYDIYKEDLEDRVLINEIGYQIQDFIENLKVTL